MAERVDIDLPPLPGGFCQWVEFEWDAAGHRAGVHRCGKPTLVDACGKRLELCPEHNAAKAVFGTFLAQQCRAPGAAEPGQHSPPGPPSPPGTLAQGFGGFHLPAETDPTHDEE